MINKESIQKLEKQNLISKIEDIDFFEYKKNWNTIFYITFTSITKVNKKESKILWNKWTSNIIISLDINNQKTYIWDIRNFQYSKKENSSIILEELNLEKKYLEELLSLENNDRYEQILNNISNSFKNHWEFWKEFDSILDKRKKENTVNKELLNDLKKVFKVLKKNNQNIENIDKVLIKVILQMLFICYLKDNKIDFLEQEIWLDKEIENINDIYKIFTKIKTKFNGELFWENQLKIWKNIEFKNEDNFDILKKVFFDRIWNLNNDQQSILFKDENDNLIFEKYNFKYIPTLLISNIYEWLLKFIYEDNKKKLWIFYTRPNVVKSILDRYLKKDLEKYDFENNFPTIYDPTCWSWVFLVSAFEMIINNLKIKWKLKLNFNKRKEILEKTIFWSDLEENSIYITEFSLYLELLKWLWNDYNKWENKFPNLLKSKNLIKWDSLLWWKFDLKINKLVLNKEFKEVTFNQEFDYIFWNPPWSKDIFSSEYKKEIEKKLNLKSVEASECFIIKSKEYVKTWWKIILLTNSKNYYRKNWNNFRKTLLENFCIDELINFNNINQYLFEWTDEPATLISLINKKKENYDIKFLKVEESNFSKYYIFTLDWKNTKYSKKELLKNINKWWILYKWDKYDLNLINYLIDDKKNLKSLTTNKAFTWFQLSTLNEKQELFTKIIDNKKNINNELFIEIDDICENKVINKNKFINYSTLDEKYLFHIIYKKDTDEISSIKNRNPSLNIFKWNKILINSKTKSFVFVWENSYFLNKTYVLKFEKKPEKYYFYILWLLNSNLINNYFLENYTSRKWLEWWQYQELIAENIKNIPIPELEENSELFKIISEFSKELYNLYQEKNKEDEIILKQKELDEYVMIAYNIFSDIDKQIIEDFNLKDLEEDVITKELEEYWKLFQNHFVNSRAWILMKRQKIIWEEINFKPWKDNFLWISWVCFSLNNWKIQEELEELNKKLFLSSLNSNNIFDWIENSRIYLSDKKYLFIIKPNKKKYWTLSNAYKDSLYENKLIFDNIKIK